jgi:hypothetical protein
VVQDSFGQIHVRGDHGNLQYRLSACSLRDGLGVGVGAPQFGQRQTVLLTLRQKF